MGTKVLFLGSGEGKLNCELLNIEREFSNLIII